MPLPSNDSQHPIPKSPNREISTDQMLAHDTSKYSQNYNERLTDKNKGLQKMMTDSNNM